MTLQTRNESVCTSKVFAVAMSNARAEREKNGKTIPVEIVPVGWAGEGESLHASLFDVNRVITEDIPDIPVAAAEPQQKFIFYNL